MEQDQLLMTVLGAGILILIGVIFHYLNEKQKNKEPSEEPKEGDEPPTQVAPPTKIKEKKEKKPISRKERISNLISWVGFFYLCFSLLGLIFNRRVFRRDFEEMITFESFVGYDIADDVSIYIFFIAVITNYIYVGKFRILPFLKVKNIDE